MNIIKKTKKKYMVIQIKWKYNYILYQVYRYYQRKKLKIIIIIFIINMRQICFFILINVWTEVIFF